MFPILIDYELVIDLQGLLKSAIVSKLLGPNVGFDKHSIREKIAALFYEKSFSIAYTENVIIRNLDLVSSALNIEIQKDTLKDKQAFLFFTKEDEKKTERFMKTDQQTIVHVLGSSWESKVYPKEKFVEIISALEGKHLLVWGNKKEEEYAHYIAHHTSATVLPKMNLNELKALISKADLVIGGDSGPTHFAWALNRPSITIFGPTPSQRNVLKTDINRVIDCGKEIDPVQLDKENFCIQKIDASKIVALAKELLHA